MRSSGILMHLSSLPSPYGIGSMGKPAREFIDFLKAAGQGYWQLLPICPTSYGDSPYQSFSTYAGNPYFIDLELLEADGLLEWQEYGEVDWESAPDRVNYGVLYENHPNTCLIDLQFLNLFGGKDSRNKLNLQFSTYKIPIL